MVLFLKIIAIGYFPIAAQPDRYLGSVLSNGMKRQFKNTIYCTALSRQLIFIMDIHREFFLIQV